MTNEVVTNQNNIATEEQASLSLMDLLGIFLHNWYWFLISIILCVSLGFLYVKITPPEYQRSATVLVKDDRRSPTLSGGDALMSMDIFKSNSNVYNELVVMKSPALTMSVVSRLGLNYSYEADGLFHTNVLYGTTLPIKVQLLDVPENKSAGFNIDVNAETGSILLSEFTYAGKKLTMENFVSIDPEIDSQWAALNAKDLKKYSATTQFSDTLQTPVGRVVINKTSYYNNERVERTIFFNKSPLLACAMGYNRRLNASLNDKQASIIDLSFTDRSISRAEDFLNTIIAIYNENWLQDRNQVSLATSIFIEERLASMEVELRSIDDAISKYKSDNLLPDVTTTSRMYLENSRQMNNEMITLNNSLMMSEYIYKYITTSNDPYQLIPAGVGLNNTSVDNQISEYNKLVLERNNLISNSSVSNPIVQSLSTQIVAMRENVVVSVSNNIVTLKEQISEMGKIEEMNNSKIADAPSQAKYLINIERQQKTKEALYLLLLEKREENELSQAFVPYNSRVVTPPIGSQKPVSPKSMMILLVCFILGVAIPGVIFYISEVSDTTVHNRTDIEGRLSVPFLGEIPLFEDEEKSKFKKMSYFLAKDKKKQTPTIVVAPHKRDVINEAFRVVRTNIDFMLTSRDCESKILMTSSLAPFSGKTFIAYNLAASFAIRGMKVLVADLDLRKLSLSEYVNKPSKGISDYLSGTISDYKSTIIHSENIKGLDVLPGGTLPPNPTELILTPRFEQFINSIKEDYDLIILDAPPAEIVADAAIINKYVDLDLFIIRAGNVDKSALNYVQTFYDSEKFKNMSIILNGTDAHYHYGYAKYGYGRYGHYGHYGHYGSYGHYGYASTKNDKVS